MNESRGVIVGLLFGVFPAQAIQAAARLGVIDHLADGPRAAAGLALATDADPDALRRLLRALACLDIVDEGPAGTFALGTHGGPLLSDSPESVRNLAQLFCGNEVWRAWGLLDEAVRTGDPTWVKVTGLGPFEYMDANPGYAAMFNEAMAEATRAALPGIVAAGRFDRFGTVVDVGGGDGTLLAAVLAANPGLRGIVYDTASGSALAGATLFDAGVDDRAEVAVGDFFASVPAGDAHLVKSVVHDWADAPANQLLARCRSALPDDGRLVLVEPVMPEVMTARPDARVMVMSDLNMLACTGGKERTESEFRALLAGAGFELLSVTPCPGPTNFCLLEAAPTG